MTVPLVMDVDTGVDDAYALLFAARHPGLDLLGVSCVDGNVGVDQVVLNTRTVLDIAGAGQVPVARGAERPLLSTPFYSTSVHGRDGLGDLGVERSSRGAVDAHAVEFLRATIGGSPQPVTLVTLAPLTNIALLLRTYPGVSKNLDRIVIMGGSAGQGNATPTAEFNVWHDPEAAAIVFASGLPITMYGLDVYFDLEVPPDRVEELAAATDAAARLAGNLLRSQLRRASDPSAEAMTTLGDYGAVAVVADPGGADFEQAPVEVVTGAGLNRGQTIVDRRSYRDSAPPDRRVNGRPIDITVAVDGDRFVDLWLTTLLAPRHS
jgi:pyrimidine-specific ribonucleoside hydrolase